MTSFTPGSAITLFTVLLKVQLLKQNATQTVKQFRETGKLNRSSTQRQNRGAVATGSILEKSQRAMIGTPFPL